MKQIKFFLLTILAVLAILSSGDLTMTADASPISYNFSSTAASGFISTDAAGNNVIADLQSVSFLISISGDTLGVIDDPLNPGNGWANLGLTGTISILGTSYSGTFADPLTVWVDNLGETIGFDNDTLGITMLALYAQNVGLNTYNLSSSFGPILADSVTAFEDFASIQTSFGYLTFETVDDATFQAVPEPATLLLLGFSVLGLTGLRRKIKS